jgi:hypothetical protein
MPPPKAQTASLLASPDDVEAQFYEAMQQADIAKLMAVWSDDDEVACVHPGGPRIIGAVAIRASFGAMFANGAVAVAAHGVQRLHTLHSAVHHVVERITLGAAHDQQHCGRHQRARCLDTADAGPASGHRRRECGPLP